MNNSKIYKRLFKDYTSKHLVSILLAAFFSIIVAGSTSSIAWLLDPAIKKIFIEKDQSLIFKRTIRGFTEKYIIDEDFVITPESKALNDLKDDFKSIIIIIASNICSIVNYVYIYISHNI